MIHAPDCECDAYACRLRAKNVSVQPGRARTTAYEGTPESQAKFTQMNRGFAGEQRPGGTFMPYLAPSSTGTLEAVPAKRGRELRHQHQEVRRRQHDQAVAAGHHH